MKYNNNNNRLQSAPYLLFQPCPYLYLFKLLCVVHRKIVEVEERLFADRVGTIQRRLGDVFKCHTSFFGELGRCRFELNVVDAACGLKVFGLLFE